MAFIEMALGIHDDEDCPATGGAHVWIEAEKHDWCGCGINRHRNDNGTVWYSRRVK